MLLEKPQILFRRSEPTILDQAPQQSHCIVRKNSHEARVFLQTSSDMSTPRWEEIGDFRMEDVPTNFEA